PGASIASNSRTTCRLKHGLWLSSRPLQTRSPWSKILSKAIESTTAWLLCRERLFAFDGGNAMVTVRAWIWEDPAIHMKSLFSLVLALAFCSAALAQPNSPDGLTYKSGYSSIIKLGKDLYSALPKSEKEFVSPQPISIETDVTPFIRLLYFPDEPKPVRG